MSKFSVISIIDETTINVRGWSWKNQTGSKVVVRGIQANDELKDLYKKRLQDLLLNEDVELEDTEFFDDKNDTIICDVLLNNVDIGVYFPELSHRTAFWW